MNSRSVALEALEAIDVRGAYADLALPACFRRYPALEARDKRQATELVYGSVRRMNTLDWAVGLFLKGLALSQCDAPVRAALRLGAYQLLYMDNIPVPVAVDATLRALSARNRRAVGLVNAVLRRIGALEGQLPYPDPDSHPLEYLALRYSHPPWMLDHMMPRLGWEEIIAWCQWNNRSPRTTLRVNRLRTSTARFTELLSCEGIAWKPGRYHEQAVRLERAGRVEELPGYEDGLFQVQDESSMLVGALLEPQPGERVLDMCAAPGGKSTHLAELMDDRGQVWAMDIHPGRVARIRESAERLGLSSIHVIEQDARELQGAEQSFDRVLLDAPCSGLGVLARRPDARWRRSPEDIPALAAVQKELLAAAGRYLRPDGVLVYSVCTLTKEEGSDVIDQFVRDHPKFSVALPPMGLARFRGENGHLTLWPHRHKTDGFVMARLSKSR